MRIVLVLLILLTAISAYAVDITITTTQEELDAVEAIVLDAKDWLQKAWDGKANNCMERVIDRETVYQAGKMTTEEKKLQIKSIKPPKRRDVEVSI